MRLNASLFLYMIELYRRETVSSGKQFLGTKMMWNYLNRTKIFKKIHQKFEFFINSDIQRTKVAYIVEKTSEKRRNFHFISFLSINTSSKRFNLMPPLSPFTINFFTTLSLTTVHKILINPSPRQQTAFLRAS